MNKSINLLFPKCIRKIVATFCHSIAHNLPITVNDRSVVMNSVYIDNEQNFMSLMDAINNVAEHYRLPVLYSTHPRSMKFIEERGFKFHPLVQNLKPFGFLDRESDA